MMKSRAAWTGAIPGLTILISVFLASPIPLSAQPADANPAGTSASADDAMLRAMFVPAPSAPLTNSRAADQMIADVRSARFNTLIVQVLSLGEAFYQSKTVPLSSGLPQSFSDPLEYIRRGAKAISDSPTATGYPLRVVAALELLPAHSVTARSQPRPGSVLALHPDWASLNYTNKGVSDEGIITLEPALPSVQAYLSSVVQELVSTYELDGVYLMGLHYPGTEAEWGYHPLVLEEFRRQFPSAPERPRPNQPDWVAFRREKMNQLVGMLKTAVRQARPSCQVFAEAEVLSPLPESTEAWEKHPVPAGMLQDWVTWGRDGLVDWVCLRNAIVQEQAASEFQSWMTFAAATATNTRIAMGISGRNNFNTGVINLIRSVQNLGLPGLVLYDYQNPTAEDRAFLMGYLGRSLFSENRPVVKLMNIQYVPPAKPVLPAAEPTTPTLPLTLTDAATTPALSSVVEETERETVEVAEEEPEPTPEPTPTKTVVIPTPSLLLATPTPVTAPLQSFRLKNGLSFKGRVQLEVDNKLTILTEDGTTIKISRDQILSPAP